MGQEVRCTQVESTFLVVTNKTQSTQPENIRYDLTATICTPGARSEYARQKYLESSIGVRVTQAKHAAILWYFPPQKRTYHARGSHFPLAFNVRVDKRGLNALSPCVLPTFKVHGEYYYRTCEVRHTQTTHVSSTIKMCQKYAHDVGKLMNPTRILVGFVIHKRI
jgi:hypothetical protein